MIVDGIVRLVRALFLLSLGLVVLSQPAMAAKPRHAVAPFLVVGPQATPAGTPADGAQYGLFTCQVVGLNPLRTCYDPYQMRHA